MAIQLTLLASILALYAGLSLSERVSPRWGVFWEYVGLVGLIGCCVSILTVFVIGIYQVMGG